jgi:hypothetical protein
MKVMLADIETDALAAALKKLRQFGPDGAAVPVTLPILPTSSVSGVGTAAISRELGFTGFSQR